MTAKNFFLIMFGFMAGLLSICCICAFSMVALSSFVSTALDDTSNELAVGNINSSNKVLLVHINGVIMNQRPENDFGFFASDVTYGYEVQEKLIEAAKDSDIKAVIISVNSPGGTVTGSNAISEGIEYFKEQTGKPVIGFGSGLVASGGYWSIAGTDKVIIDAGSIVGSIGVISAQLTVYNDVIAEGSLLGETVTTRGGIQKFYITAGKGKDLGDPYRKPTVQEIKLLQDQADNIYDDFVAHVLQYRKELTSEKIRNELGAYVYDTEQAIAFKLADEEGTRQDAIAAALAAASLNESDYQLVEFPKRNASPLGNLFGAQSLAFALMNGQQPAQTCGLLGQTIVYHGSLASLCK
jgi:protease-4